MPVVEIIVTGRVLITYLRAMIPIIVIATELVVHLRGTTSWKRHLVAQTRSVYLVNITLTLV